MNICTKTGISITFLLGFLKRLRYICAMRIFQSICILSFLFFASNQCNAGIFDSSSFKVYNHLQCAEQTDLNDSNGPVHLIHFFQRTEQVKYVSPADQEFSGELFLRFSKMEESPAKLIPSFLFCIPIGITLIFPKHYFF